MNKQKLKDMLFEYSFSSTEIELLLDIIFSEVIPEVLQSCMPEESVPDFFTENESRNEFKQKALELYNITL